MIDSDFSFDFERTGQKNVVQIRSPHNPVTNLDTNPFSDSLVRQKDMTDVLRTQGDDEEINAAIAEAQRRLPEFRRVIEEDSHRILPVHPRAFVKVCIDSEAVGAFEHVWLEGVFFEGTEVGGQVVTSVAGDSQLKEGAKVVAPMKQISDWMYYEGDALRGAFVERILMRRAGIEE